MSQMGDRIREATSKLEAIQDQILELVDNADELLSELAGDNADDGFYRRAKAYWLPHIRSAAGHLDGNPYDTSIRTTLDELPDLIPQCETCDRELHDHEAGPLCDDCHWGR